MNDSNFLKLLQDAQRDPKGAAARKVVKRVLTFINLSSSSIPWGSRERAGEMTKLMAAHRYCGPSSIFYSIAPDDVHNVSRILDALGRGVEQLRREFPSRVVFGQVSSADASATHLQVWGANADNWNLTPGSSISGGGMAIAMAVQGPFVVIVVDRGALPVRHRLE